MIVEQMVPEIYYKDSRDFAYISRLIEIILNYMKTAADNVWVEPSENVNANIIDLLVNTLGFESKHEYITRDLVYVASSFSEMLRNKGSMNAIEMAVRTLLNSQRISLRNIEKTYDYDKQTKTLTIYIPTETIDLVLLDDIMDYILPAGIIYQYLRVENSVDFGNLTKPISDIETEDIVEWFYPISQGDDPAHAEKHTTRLHYIEGDESIPTADENIGTLATGTTIDGTLGQNQGG